MKQACIASLAASLKRTASWRLNNAQKFPTDRRYARAAKRLEKLASEVPNLSIEQWTALEPYFQSTRWHEALRETSRLLAFAVKKMSLGYFVRKLAGLLSEPVA